MVDTEVCQGLKAAVRNNNPNKAAGSDKIQPMFLHHLDPVSLLMSIINKSWMENKVPKEWRVADIRPMPKGEKDLQKIESYRPMSLTLSAGKTMDQLVIISRRHFDKSMHLLTEHQAGIRHGRSTEDQWL